MAHQKETDYMNEMDTKLLKARVVNGRLVLDEPTDLPEGSEVQLVVVDEGDLDDEERAALNASLERGMDDLEAGRSVSSDVILAKNGDELDDEERAALHASLRASIEDMRAGRLIDGDVVMAEIRARRTKSEPDGS
jgi:predicted transcriptional regulator